MCAIYLQKKKRKSDHICHRISYISHFVSYAEKWYFLLDRSKNDDLWPPFLVSSLFLKKTDILCKDILDWNRLMKCIRERENKQIEQWKKTQKRQSRRGEKQWSDTNIKEFWCLNLRKKEKRVFGLNICHASLLPKYHLIIEHELI